MPYYDYRCQKCGAVFEEKRAMTDTTPCLCRFCGAEAMREITPPGIVFKGSGFYATDSRKAAGNNQHEISQ